MNVEKWNTIETVTPLRTVGHASIHRAYYVQLAWVRVANGNIKGSLAVHLNARTVIVTQQKVDCLCFGNCIVKLWYVLLIIMT